MDLVTCCLHIIITVVYLRTVVLIFLLSCCKVELSAACIVSFGVIIHTTAPAVVRVHMM